MMSADMLLRTWQMLEYRLDVVRANEGVLRSVRNFESLTTSHSKVHVSAEFV